MTVENGGGHSNGHLSSNGKEENSSDDDDSRSSDNNCFFCDKPARLECQHCNVVGYCSHEHFLVHRPKAKCFPFKIRQNAERGFHFVAARDIKALEVILEEYPITMGPYSKSLPQCLQCFKPFLKESECVRCSSCNFPVCDEDCENGSLHRIECEILRRAGFRASVDAFYTFQMEYAFVNTLRTLTLKGGFVFAAVLQ